MTNKELAHFGIPGMHWGKRTGHTKTGYKSTSIRAALARRSNDKTDAGFKDWGENTKKKTNAIDIGKKRNEAKMAFEKDPKNKTLKVAYKLANREYKKSLRENTIYRKGVVKQEVGKDISRKYLSEAKKIKKDIDSGKADSTAKKKYEKLMNQYDIERASARRAVEVASKRSAKRASMKRNLTIAVKTAAVTATVGAGAAYANKKMVEQGRRPIDAEAALRYAKKVKEVLGYI